MNSLSIEISKLHKKTDAIQCYIKNDLRYKSNNEPICGEAFGYPFKMSSFGWIPSCEGGHIRINLKTNVYEIWDNIWKKDRDEVSEEFRNFVKEMVSDFDQLEKDILNSKDDQHKASIYNIRCLQEYIEDYSISEFIIYKFDSPYITYCTIVDGSIRMFFNFRNVPEFEKFDDMAIDRVIDYLLPKLSKISIQPDDISFVQFTELGGWYPPLLELFEDELIRHDVRSTLLDEAIGKIQAKRRCREQLKTFRESFEDYNEIFFFNKLVNPNHNEEYNMVMQLLNI